MHLRFWFKTALHRFTPGGFGYMRTLRRWRDPRFDLARDAHPVRRKHHGRGGWRRDRQGPLRYRDYQDYQEYVDHQRQKLDEILKIRGGFSNREVTAYRLKFYRRFRHLRGLLPAGARILCCGARQGTEVEVLRDLGYPHAYGIDLNPGPDNPFVRPGDFMHLDEADRSLDLIYSNCLDHAFDLEAMLDEHLRVLKPGGYVLYDVNCAEEAIGGAFEAVSWDSAEDLLLFLLRRFPRLLRAQREEAWIWFLLQRP